MRKTLLAVSAVIFALVSGAVWADLGYNPGSVVTIFDFLCFSTKHCSAHVNINSAGTEIGTSGAPVRTDPTGTTTQPVSATALPLPTGAATSALQTTMNTALGTPFQAGGSIGNTAFGATQSGTWTVQPGNTANTTPWLVTARMVGNAGGIFDAATGAAVPANAHYWGVNIAGNLVGPTGLALGATIKAPTVAIVDGSGNQVTSFGGSGGTASNFGSAFPSTGTAIGLTTGTNMVAWSATTNYGTAPAAIAVPAVNASVTASALPTGAATAANQQSLATYAGGTLGAMANYGTSPGAVLVPGANVFVTNNLTTGTAGVPSAAYVSMQGNDLIVTPISTITRPANTTAYASGQLVANNTVAGSVTPFVFTAARASGAGFYIRRVRITLSSKSVTLTSFRVHFYTVTPTIANGDGAAWSTTLANYVCKMDVPAASFEAGTDVSIGFGVPTSGDGNECNVAPSTNLLYALIEARAAYVPASAESISVIPEIHQN